MINITNYKIRQFQVSNPWLITYEPSDNWYVIRYKGKEVLVAYEMITFTKMTDIMIRRQFDDVKRLYKDLNNLSEDDYQLFAKTIKTFGVGCGTKKGTP